MRDRIERALGAWGHFVYRHARWVIALVLLTVAGLVTQLPQLRIDTSTESFLHEDDPARVTYEAFRDQFGRDERILIAIEPPEIFALDFLEKLRSFHRELEETVPKLQEVTSLVNARHSRGEGDRLIVEDLLEDWPQGPEDLARIRERALSNPLYRDNLLDRQGKLTTVAIETDVYSSIGVETSELGGFGDEAEPAERVFLTGEENSAIVEAVQRVIDRWNAPDFRISLAGSPSLNHELQTALTRDMARFTILSILTIAALLGLLFRRVAGVILPLATAVLSVVSTFSLMVVLDAPISLVSQIVPSFLLAVGVGASVHLLTIFYQALERGESKEDAVASALAHSGLAIVMTSLTTAGGLLSFSVAELAPIAEFGVTTPIGVMISLFLTMVLLPALIAVFPLRTGRGAARARLGQRALQRVGELAVRRAPAVVLASAGLLAIAGLGAAQLSFSHHPLSWFPEDSDFARANLLMNERLRGVMFLESLIDTGRENGLHEPEALRRLDEIRRWSTSVQKRDLYIGKTISLVDVSKEIHKALNENREEFYAIPDQRELVAQELLLFENSGSDDLEELVDSRFQVARITMKMPFVDAIQYGAMIEAVEENFERILGDEADFTLTGLMALVGRTFTAVIVSMARSYVIAFLVISPLMVLLIGSLRLGLTSMIPNLAPILITLGLMGWTGLKLDAFTLLIGSIAIGLAVDDTIHFMHNFRRYYARSGDVPTAVRETLTTTGQALLFTTLVLSSGFFIYGLATLKNVISFGLLTGFTILVAFLADVVLAPALVALVAPRSTEPAAEAALTEGGR